MAYGPIASRDLSSDDNESSRSMETAFGSGERLAFGGVVEAASLEHLDPQRAVDAGDDNGDGRLFGIITGLDGETWRSDSNHVQV